ncbi:MAG: histidine kinase [Solirubrobacteraceae bacterium]
MSSEEHERVREAAELGLGALTAVVAGSRDGIVVVTAERRYVYANPAACRIMGYSLEELRGLPDFLLNFPEREHQAMLDHFAEQLAGTTGLWTSTLLRPDGTEREITWSNMSFEIDGQQHGAAIFRDTTEARQAARNAAALGQTAAQVAGRSELWEIFGEIARHAVEGTRAVACAIATADEHGVLRAGGSVGVGDDFRALALSGAMRLQDLPDADVLLSGRTAVVPDARARWLEPERVAIGKTLQDFDWEAAVHIPLMWGENLLGGVGVFLGPGVTGPTEEELAFYTALADQAAVAVVNERLLSETGEASALRERARLARDLHDSVSQALFSMTLHARTAQLAMDRLELPTEGPLADSIAQLRELTQGALAEMRALIFELRPDALAQEGLAAALTKQAAALTSRTEVNVEVTGPDERLDLPPQTEEHAYRIALEALNNSVKHAHAQTARVDITADHGRLELQITDDGAGFDTSEEHPGHLGLGTMHERANAINGTLEIRSQPGRGTTVRLLIP